MVSLNVLQHDSYKKKVHQLAGRKRLQANTANFTPFSIKHQRYFEFVIVFSFL
jgi:hypothetical protein